MFTKVWQDINSGQIAPVYLLFGEESYFIDETIKRLKKAINEEQKLSNLI